MAFTHEPGRVFLRGRLLPEDEARGILRIFMQVIREGDHDSRAHALDAASELVQARINANRGSAL